MRPYQASQLVQAFASNRRALREAQDLSQEALAGKAGLDRTYVSSCERGERNITLATLDRLSIALGVTPETLLATGSHRE